MNLDRAISASEFIITQFSKFLRPSNPRLPDISRKSMLWRFILSNEPIVFGIWYRISRSNYSALLARDLIWLLISSIKYFELIGHINPCIPIHYARKYILLFLFELRPTRTLFSFSFSTRSISTFIIYFVAVVPFIILFHVVQETAWKPRHFFFFFLLLTFQKRKYDY